MVNSFELIITIILRTYYIAYIADIKLDFMATPNSAPDTRDACCRVTSRREKMHIPLISVFRNLLNSAFPNTGHFGYQQCLIFLIDFVFQANCALQ